jgi:hypothetical protein
LGGAFGHRASIDVATCPQLSTEGGVLTWIKLDSFLEQTTLWFAEQEATIFLTG